MPDSEKLGRAYERRKLKVNVGKSKVKRCSRHVTAGRMHERRNGEPVEVDCFSTLGRKWQRLEDAEGMWYTE